MTTEEVVKIIETEKACVLRNVEGCDRRCSVCDLCLADEDIIKAYDMVIKALEKQEQGLIIELPVPIGSTVYRIDMFTSIQKCEKCRFYNHNESYEYSACNISYTDYCHANCYQIEKITNVDEKFIIYHWDDFGKTISSSLEEAENLLEELRIQGLHTCSSTGLEKRE